MCRRRSSDGRLRRNAALEQVEAQDARERASTSVDPKPHDGAGSAAIRTQSWKYAPTSFPRAIGIPTGWSVASGGFKVNGDTVIASVAIDNMSLILNTPSKTTADKPKEGKYGFLSMGADTKDTSCTEQGTHCVEVLVVACRRPLCSQF